MSGFLLSIFREGIGNYFLQVADIRHIYKSQTHCWLHDAVLLV